MAMKIPATLLFAALLLAAGVAEGRQGGNDDNSGSGGGRGGSKVWKAKAKLSGANEVPPVAGSSLGTFEIKITNSWEAIVSWELKFSKISGVVAAHIHEGAAGANGPVKAWLLNPPAGTVINATTGTKSFKAAGAPYAFTALRTGWAPATPVTTPTFFKDKAAAGLLYINVHTTQFPGGAIRGQLLIDE